MLTRLQIKNFKNLADVDIELGQSVVFIGPNNSGKTTALQALALWYVGMQHWISVFSRGDLPAQLTIDDMTGVLGGLSLNRLDLTAIPIPDTALLWHELYTQNSTAVYIEISVNGILDQTLWESSLKFRFANSESIEVMTGVVRDNILHIPHQARQTQIAFLPPMSGLTAIEPRIERGRVNVLIGEGRTAEVLRNLCYQIYESNGDTGHWDHLTTQIRDMFGVELHKPDYLPARGEIRMAYQDRSGIILDLSASGRGMLQVLLLLAYLYANPGAVLLLDEPDAHLEIIRQREIYHLIKSVAQEQGSQIIAASHSEVVLEEAAKLDTVVAFIGKPHTVSRPDQLKKALRDIHAADYYQAEKTGWVLYLEGATDLAILRAFAEKLNHPAVQVLAEAYVYYLETDSPGKAEPHFYGLKEAFPELIGLVITDQGAPQQSAELFKLAWRQREIENYLMFPQTLLDYARSEFKSEEAITVMQQEIEKLEMALQTQRKPSPWSGQIKASDEFLDPLFANYFERMGLPNLMYKTNYHVLVRYAPSDKIDPEVIEKLDAIVETANKAVKP